MICQSFRSKKCKWIKSPMDEKLYVKTYIRSYFKVLLLICSFLFVSEANTLNAEHWRYNAHLCLWRYFFMYSSLLSTSQTRIQVSPCLASINFYLSSLIIVAGTFLTTMFLMVCHLYPENMIDVHYLCLEFWWRITTFYQLVKCVYYVKQL